MLVQQVSHRMEFNIVNTQHKDVKHKTKKGILGPLTLAKIDGLSALFCIYSCSRMDVSHLQFCW